MASALIQESLMREAPLCEGLSERALRRVSKRRNLLNQRLFQNSGGTIGRRTADHAILITKFCQSPNSTCLMTPQRESLPRWQKSRLSNREAMPSWQIAH
jgi:hypothetical protein